MSSTHKALVLSSFDSPPKATSVSTPTPGTGSVLVSVLATPVLSYMGEILNNNIGYPLTLPMVPGNSFVGRILAVGPDAVALKPGQLIFVPSIFRARDDPKVQILWGLHGGAEQGMKLMGDNWRDASWQEKALVPLEQCFALDEAVLTKNFGYSPVDILKINTMLVGFGGLRDIDLKQGETIIVAPATGHFGGAAVHMALSLGASVVACGRNAASLDAMKAVYAAPSPYVAQFLTVVMTGASAKDTTALMAATPKGEGADCFLDFSPYTVSEGNDHVLTCFMAVKQNGRVSLMGGIRHNVSLPYALLMFKSIKVCGKFMYDLETVRMAIRMMERGVLRLGAKATGDEVTVFEGLDRWEEACKVAAEKQGWRHRVVLAPVQE